MSAAVCTTDVVTLVVGGSGGYALEAFRPSTGLLTKLGPLDCDGSGGAIGLAADRDGGLYVTYGLSFIGRVTATAAGFACPPPSATDVFGIDAGFLQPLGIGFAGLPDGGEALYGAFFVVGFGDPLGIVNLDDGHVDVVGMMAVSPAPLTGTVDGHLYTSDFRAVYQIDPGRGALVQTFARPAPPYDVAVGPLAAWGSDFYLFEPNDTGSNVLRFRPSDATMVVVGTVDGPVVAAAVSACDPR